jgi:hypothetical protein
VAQPLPLSASGEWCSDLSHLFAPANDLAAVEGRRTADTRRRGTGKGGTENLSKELKLDYS